MTKAPSVFYFIQVAWNFFELSFQQTNKQTKKCQYLRSAFRYVYNGFIHIKF